MQVKWWRSGFFYILLLIVVVALVFALTMSHNGPDKVSLNEFVEMAQQEGTIDTIEHNGETLTGLKSGKSVITTIFKADTDAVADYLQKEGVNLAIA